MYFMYELVLAIFHDLCNVVKWLVPERTSPVKLVPARKQGGMDSAANVSECFHQSQDIVRAQLVSKSFL